MRTASLRPVTVLPQGFTVWCTNLQKQCNPIIKVLYCFTVASGLPGYASDYNEDIKGRRLQRACNARWLSSEAIVRARSEILVFGPH